MSWSKLNSDLIINTCSIEVLPDVLIIVELAQCQEAAVYSYTKVWQVHLLTPDFVHTNGQNERIICTTFLKPSLHLFDSI
jgi:hypothetical protein